MTTINQLKANGSTAMLLDVLDRSRYMFYLVNPYDNMFPDLNVPRYVSDMIPVFVLIALLENLARILKGKPILRLNDTIASLSSGIFQDSLRLHVRSFEVLFYCVIYDNFRLTTLPWNSLFTWLLCFFLIDWGFYWAHRLAHEVNFIWAIHQAHHSGEDFTLLTAIRQAYLQPFTAWLTYTPLAFIGIPPSIFLTHLQLIELYMIWIHTEVVESLGPLEWILNCPSHHRVHHGRNMKYIDKNYSGVLIIWDRIFGTYEDEDPNEPVVYGLVKPVESYNIFYLQLHSWIAIFHNMYNIEGWKNKLFVLFKGPSWAPGKPRLGYIDEIPKIEYPVTYWDPPINIFQKAYVILHFAVVLLFYQELSLQNNELSQLKILVCIISVLTSLTSIGFLLENKKYGFQFEMVRCLVFFFVEQHLNPLTELTAIDSQYRFVVLLSIRLTFLLSAILCAVIEFQRVSAQLIDYANKLIH